MVLRYLDRPHRPREIAPRCHPVPQLVEVVPLLLWNSLMLTASTPGAPLLTRTFSHALYTRRLSISNDFTFGLGVSRGSSPDELASGFPWSAQPLGSSPITGPSSLLRAAPPQCPASVLCPLQLSPLGGLPFAGRGATGPFERPQQHRDDWILLFRTSACDELTPPLHRAPPGQQAGSPLVEGTPKQRAFVPGAM